MEINKLERRERTSFPCMGKSDSDTKKTKKAKKDKKEKKRKKEKKSKKKRHKSSSSSSTSDSDVSGDEWVEKCSSQPTPAVSSTSNQTAQRDEWMTAPGLFACVTRDQLRAAKQPTEKQKKEEAAKFMLDRPGQSGRELNPFWKDGGTGLPAEKPEGPESVALASTTVGDQGANWLRRAMQRAKEQAAESGKSLEEVASERWGSLAKLEELLAEAEGRRHAASASAMWKPDGRHGSARRDDYRRDWKRELSSKGKRDGSPDNDRRDRRVDDDRRDRRMDDDRRDRRMDDDIRDRRSSRNEDSKVDNWRKSDRRDGRHAYGGMDRHDHGRGSDSSSTKPSFRRPGYSEDEFQGSRSKCRFARPSEEDGECGSDSSAPRTDRSSSSGAKNWKKKEFIPKTDTGKQVKQSEQGLKEAKVAKLVSSSDEGSDSENEGVQKESEIEVLSDQQMNELAAKLVKAEILGNDELVAELKAKLSAAREFRTKNPAAVAATKLKKKEDEVIILTRTDTKGFSRPIQPMGAHPEPSGGRRKKQKVDTHGVDGKRDRYFPDDDKYSLKDMFQREKLTTVDDDNEMFTNLAGKDGRQEHDYDMDDIFSERARQKESDGKTEARERQRAIKEHTQKQRTLDNCRWCFDSKQLLRHLVVSLGSKSYICLPPFQSLTEGHCLVVPLHHTTCATQLDEDVWEEMQNFRKALVKMFLEDDEDCIWFESAMYLNKFPHMVWHCVPVPRETGDMAPIYFKKAILECETEWSTNKKLVDLSSKDVRHSVPKGLPYFAVDFGLQGGFAHVIEDEKMFPTNFAQEIIGGVLDLDHSIWRKPRNENFDKQRTKVVAFSKRWQPFDFNKKKNPSSATSDNSSS